MRYEGICEYNEGNSSTEQAFVSNYDIIKKMIGTVNNNGVIEFNDDIAKNDEVLDNGSVYSQGLDDVSFNIQEPIEKVNRTNDFSQKSVVETKQVVEEPKITEEVKDNAVSGT